MAFAPGMQISDYHERIKKMRLPSRVTIPGALAVSLLVGFDIIGAGCGAAEDSALTPAAAPPQVVLLSDRDADHDGDSDLTFITRSDREFITTLLLDQGGGDFTVRRSHPVVTTTADGQFELQPQGDVEWWDEAGGDIHTLTGTLEGLTAAIELLSSPRREALGVAGGGGPHVLNYYDCEEDYACGFEHERWGGDTFQVARHFNVKDLSIYSFNDKISSIRNNDSKCWVDWWEHPDYSGRNWGQSPKNDVANVGSWWNDRISAIHWGAGCYP